VIPTRATLILVALALGATGASGCGGDDDGGQNGDGGGNGDRPLEVDQYEVAYDAARTSCAADGVQRLASEFGVEATPEAVAEAYAEEVSTPGEAQDGSRDGCLDGLAGE
jgi:hypothetical protein